MSEPRVSYTIGSQFTAAYNYDEYGRPTHGRVSGDGFVINWHDETLATNESGERALPETIIQAVLHRLEFLMDDSQQVESGLSFAVSRLKNAIEDIERYRGKRVEVPWEDL